MSMLEWLAHYGAGLAIGVSCVLALGCLAIVVVRAPFERRRLGAWTLSAVVLYLGCAWLSQRPTWLSASFVPSVLEAPTTSVPSIAKPASDRESVERPGALGAPQGGVLGPPTQGSLDRPKHGSLGPPNGGILAPPAHGELVTDRSVAPLPLRSAGVADDRPTRTASSLGALLAGLWSLGAIAMLLWIAIGILRLRALLARSEPAPAWLAQLATPRVRVVVVGTRAFCAGLFRPVIVLPHEVVQPGREAAARALLTHELAHVRAGDCRLQMGFVALAPLLWWQPLFWWLRARVRFAAELLADDAASRSSSIHDYARELLDIAAGAPHSVDPAGAVSVFQRPSEFYQRMQMLLQRRVPLSRSVSLRRRLSTALAALAVVLGVAFNCGVARAQEPDAVALRVEVEQLRATIAALRSELAALRERVEPATLEQPAEVPAAESTVAMASDATTAPREPRMSSLAELLSMVTKTIELRGEIELVEAEFERVRTLAQQALVEASAQRTVEIRHRVLTQQLKVSELLLRSELEHANRRLKSMDELRKAGRLTDSDERLAATFTAVRVLESVLQNDSGR